MDTRVQWCVERWGQVDLLVKNASTWTYESLRKTTDDDMETMWQSGPMASLRFMQSAVESGRFGIRVNSICPVAMSPYTEAREADQPGAIDRPISMNPLGRIGDAEADIGRSVVYLASDAGRYVTGTTLMVDGGFSDLR